jgi:hypothetical protein
VFGASLTIKVDIFLIRMNWLVCIMEKELLLCSSA